MNYLLQRKNNKVCFSWRAYAMKRDFPFLFTENGLRKLFRTIFGKEISEHKAKNMMQFIKFGIVGMSNTLISYILYSFSLLLFKYFQILPGTDYLAAQVIQYVLSVLWSFYWNNKYVFGLQEGEHRSWLRALIKTYIAYSFTGLFLNSVLLVLWIRILRISEFAAPFINLLVSMPLNFFINKVWAFKKAAKDKTDAGCIDPVNERV